MNHFLVRLASVATLGLPLHALAQQAPEPATAKPASPLRHASAFADYKPWQDIKPGNWRQLNDALVSAPGAPGGHAAHGTQGGSAPAMHDMHRMPGGRP